MVDSNGLSWYKISNNVWIPDPRHNVAVTWLRSAMVLKRFRWDVLLHDLEETLGKGTGNPSEYAETVRLRFGTLLQGKNGDITCTSTLLVDSRGEEHN